MKEMTPNIIEKSNALLVEEAEAKKSMQEFKKNIKEDLEHIKTFTYKNIDELLQMIFDKCQEITEIEYYIDVIKKLMQKDEETKEKLEYQKSLTRKDIINNNAYSIYGTYTATAIASMLFTNNPISFIQNFVLLTTIQVFAFKINLDYFSSDKYKNKITKTIKQIDESTIIDEYNLKMLFEFRRMCIEELKIEISKLYEILQKRKNYRDVNDRISVLLNGMNLEFVLEDKNVLTKRRKR